MLGLMRIRSDIWVKAYVRRRTAQGCFAGVTAHGDDMAGAIYIKINRLDGQVVVFGPAPAGMDEVDTERRFACVHKTPTLLEAEADAQISRQREFDSDLWVIEVEDRRGEHGLDGWLATDAH
jgi:hypothetical protein